METTMPFFQYLFKFIDLSREEYAQLIEPYIKIREFAKKEVITTEGEVENYFNFILKGLVRKYYKKEREEINTQISMEGHIIHAQESFHSRTPSEFFVETIEPSSLVSISYNDLEKIYSQSARMERLGRLIITFTVMLSDKWQMHLIKLTPRERFLKFVQQNPKMLQRVPQKYLASYLNIQPETFSRFKHLLKERKQ